MDYRVCVKHLDPASRSFQFSDVPDTSLALSTLLGDAGAGDGDLTLALVRTQVRVGVGFQGTGAELQVRIGPTNAPISSIFIALLLCIVPLRSSKLRIGCCMVQVHRCFLLCCVIRDSALAYLGTLQLREDPSLTVEELCSRVHEEASQVVTFACILHLYVCVYPMYT